MADEIKGPIDLFAALKGEGKKEIRTVLADERRKLVLIALREGELLAAHKAIHPITIHCLEREGELGIGEERVELRRVVVVPLDAHVMHSEWYSISDPVAERILAAKRAGRPIVAIGTTVTRTLESWALDARPRVGDTTLLIQPGYRFTVIDQLFTNFHLPRSTLIALVMAFAGEDFTRAAYERAVRERYRFFSYGDAMLVQ